MFWYIIFMAGLFYVTVVLPFGLFYSETDEENEFVSSGDFKACSYSSIRLEMAHLFGFQK